MNAGLPATGIGGFFYILCAFIMPFIELYKTLRGESNWERWQTVLKQLFMAIGIILMLEATGWIIKTVFGIKPNYMGQVAATNQSLLLKILDNSFVAIPFLISFATLMFAISGVTFAKLLYLWRHSEEKNSKTS